MLIVVVLPAPLGQKAEQFALDHLKAHIRNSPDLTESLGQSLYGDGDHVVILVSLLSGHSAFPFVTWIPKSRAPALVLIDSVAGSLTRHCPLEMATRSVPTSTSASPSIPTKMT